MDLHKIKQIIHLLQHSTLTEIEIHEKNESVLIRRQNIVPEQTQMQVIKEVKTHDAYKPTLVSTANAKLNILDAMKIKSAPTIDRGYVVKSSLVGKFYRAAKDAEQPYVQIGSEVSVGDIIGIIEAMNTPNYIIVEHGGKITEILVQDGQGIEFGQSLFVIE